MQMNYVDQAERVREHQRMNPGNIAWCQVSAQCPFLSATCRVTSVERGRPLSHQDSMLISGLCNMELWC